MSGGLGSLVLDPFLRLRDDKKCIYVFAGVVMAFVQRVCSLCDVCF